MLLQRLSCQSNFIRSNIIFVTLTSKNGIQSFFWEKIKHFVSFSYNIISFACHTCRIQNPAFFLGPSILHKNMQSKDGISTNNSQQATGICHKLINFIINNLLSPSFKRLTMGHTPRSDTDHEILLQEHSRKRDGSDTPSSEIVIDFRHHEDWTSNKAAILSDTNQEKSYQTARNGNVKPQVQGTGVGELEATSTNAGIKRKGAKKTITFKEDQNSDRVKQQQQQLLQQQKDKNITTTGARSEPEVVRRPRLLSVASNINEKADAFIKSRLEAMRKSFAHD